MKKKRAIPTNLLLSYGRALFTASITKLVLHFRTEVRLSPSSSYFAKHPNPNHHLELRLAKTEPVKKYLFTIAIQI